jgi:hypothetical protein
VIGVIIARTSVATFIRIVAAAPRSTGYQVRALLQERPVLRMLRRSSNGSHKRLFALPRSRVHCISVGSTLEHLTFGVDTCHIPTR